ncbi:MAG: ribosomal protein S18-alanine N-acetyltransferase [Cyanobacteria bacterium P01_H01_bin.15]
MPSSQCTTKALTSLALVLSPLQISQVQAAVELDQRYLGGLWREDGYQREVTSPNSLVVGIMNSEQNQLIGLGCCWHILDEAHITLLLIAADYRGLGLGKQLLITLLKDAVNRGLERATLEVRESNNVAIALYQKLGFTMAGKRPGYYQDPPECALIFWRKELNTPAFSELLDNCECLNHGRLKAAHVVFTIKGLLN